MIENLPEHWRHDPSISDVGRYTVAMHMAIYGTLNFLPIYWRHDPYL